MTQDEIIEMARQVGMRYREIEDEFYSGYADGVYLDELEAFAKLVAERALAQPHETTLKEFNQFIHDDPNYHIWAKKREAKVEGSLHVVCQCDKCKAHPPQRTWVGLTQKEVQEIHDTFYKRMGPQEFASMIEAKLKEKNT